MAFPPTATITASTDGHISDNATIQVHDNDVGVLTVTLPTTATEGDGVLAGVGTVTVDQSPTVDVVVQLSSNDTTELTVPNTVTILAGEMSTTFDLTVMDEGLFDGPQTADITAHVEGWTDGIATMDILENGNLTVSLPAEAWEGDGVLEQAGMVTFSCPVPEDTVVSLLSSDPTVLFVPDSVTILAGATSAGFDITIVDDTVQDGSQAASVTASVSGLVAGSGSVDVWDDELNHLAFGDIGNQAENTPFNVHVSAYNVDAQTIPSFGELTFEATGLNGPVDLTVEHDNGFSDGVWLGQISIHAIDAGIALQVSDGLGNTTTSEPFDLALAAPSDLTAEWIWFHTDAILSWVDNSNFETGYEIQRRWTPPPNSSLPAEEWHTIATVPANTASYTDAGISEISPGYAWRVRALSDDGDSEYVLYPGLWGGQAFTTTYLSSYESDEGNLYFIRSQEGFWADLNRDGNFDIMKGDGTALIAIPGDDFEMFDPELSLGEGAVLWGEAYCVPVLCLA